ncbi:MAG: leucyl aminopeptidase [Candidatus Micrarchaeota archaeon]|nr:leucyl aminopeptidase [Candidatus Micrarchaeota archaeon]
MDMIKDIYFKTIENSELTIFFSVAETQETNKEKKETKEPNKIYVRGNNVIEYVIPNNFKEDSDIIRKVGGNIIDYLLTVNVKKVNLDLTNFDSQMIIKLIEGMMIASYQFNIKSKAVEPRLEIGLVNVNKSLEKEYEDLKTQFYYVNLTRDLVNGPANIVTIDEFVERIKKEAKNHEHVTLKVLNSDELEKLGLNQILAVGKGSVNKPKLLIMTYNPSQKNKDSQNNEYDLALVGKGVIFDSGGLSLKPAKSMETMKEDMAGAATVMAITLAISKLRLNKKIIALAPLVENMPSGSATKPGDVIKSYTGKTVEVLNTDAEGRLILGDTIAYAYKNYKFKKLVDFATLTGACIIALGPFAAAILGNDDALIKDLIDCGEKTGERLWQLPTWSDYSELIKSKIADIKNIGIDGLGAGTIVGAVFIKEFVENKNWAHIDFASTAFHEQKIKYYHPGATGFGVRLVIDYVKNKLN